MDEKRNAPLVVELPASDQDVTPETAPPIPEAGLDAGQRPTSFQATTLMLGRRPGRALRWAVGFFSAYRQNQDGDRVRVLSHLSHGLVNHPIYSPLGLMNDQHSK